MHIVGNDQDNSRKRRRWTAAEKAQMLSEAESSSFSEVARKYGLATSLLFQWRKQSQGKDAADQQSPEVHYTDRLRTIDDLERQVEPRVIERLMLDIDTGKLNGYSAANAYASISNAIARLCAARLELIDRMIAINADKEPQQAVDNDFDHPEDSVRKKAEQTLYEMIKQQVEEEKAAAKRSAGLHS